MSSLRFLSLPPMCTQPVLEVLRYFLLTTVPRLPFAYQSVDTIFQFWRLVLITQRCTGRHAIGVPVNTSPCMFLKTSIKCVSFE
jgi:hypothetical protein